MITALNPSRPGQGFDYLALDRPTRQAILELASQIGQKKPRWASVEEIVEIGHKLIGIKRELGHGKFGVWLKTEFPGHPNTARYYMRVAQWSAQKNTKFVFLQQLTPSALYLLTAPSVAEAARQEVLRLLEEGEKVNYKLIKAIATLPSPLI